MHEAAVGGVEVRDEPPTSEVAAGLIAALSIEISDRYVERYPVVGDGRSNFRPEAFDPEHDAFIVAWADGEPVACGALRRFDGRRVEVKRMFVAGAARGRGIGRIVLAALEQRAARLGYDEILLETGILQPEAIGLYESAGYVPHPPWPPYDEREYARCYAKRIAGV